MIPQVVYSDNHLLVVSKPVMMVTQKTEGHPDSLEDWAKEWVRRRYGKNGAVFLHAIHRLDRETEGLVLFAKTSKALSRLNLAMREGKIKKVYRAILEGSLSSNEGTLSHQLEHGEHRAHIGSGKTAVLHYRVIERYPGKTLVEIELETGRYHQIRAQFSAIGHPIVGDQKYGSLSKKDPDQGIALCHVRLTFPHPIGGHLLTVDVAKLFPTALR